jgi:hypothetical protein
LVGKGREDPEEVVAVRANGSCDLSDSHPRLLAQSLQCLATTVTASARTARLPARRATASTRSLHRAVTTEETQGANQALVLLHDWLDLVDPGLDVLYYCINVVYWHF